MTTDMSRDACLATAAAKLSELASEFHHDGVPADSARRSRLEDSRASGSRLLLRVHAFKPTGVALGCPLPDVGVQRQFSALCDRAEEKLGRITGVTGPTISRVPADAYHVTLVNRTHFDLESDKRNVHPLSQREKEQVERIVREQGSGPVVLRYRGLIATRSGRLMVPAYAEDAGLFHFKECLRDGVLDRSRRPVLGANYPVHTVTKIGHIGVGLQGAHLSEFRGWLDEEAAGIDVSVRFVDLYTQRGRIRL
jgi:hypothetical protein